MKLVELIGRKVDINLLKQKLDKDTFGVYTNQLQYYKQNKTAVENIINNITKFLNHNNIDIKSIQLTPTNELEFMIEPHRMDVDINALTQLYNKSNKAKIKNAVRLTNHHTYIITVA